MKLEGFEFSQLGYNSFVDGYEIFKDGTITKDGKKLNTCINTQGYKTISLKGIEKRFTCYIHHLIYYYFIDKDYFTKRKYHLQIDHINQNRLDNNVENLRAITKMENLKNRKKPDRKKKKTLIEDFNDRYSEEDKKKIYEMLKEQYN